MKQIVSVCLLALCIGLAAQTQAPGPIPMPMSANGLVPQPSREVPEWSFNVAPIPILNNFFDYMPGSYNSTPIRVQSGSTEGTNGVYILFHSMETSNSTRRENIAYYDPTNNNIQVFYIGGSDVREGYGGISLDPDTQDPFCSWHIDYDGNGVYECAFNYDLWHTLHIPGLIGTAFTVIPNEDWSGTGYTPPYEDDEFEWPYVFITQAPSFATAGKHRLYVMGNNGTSHYTNPSENILIAYADYSTNDLNQGQMDSLDWNYCTIPQMDAWNASAVWIRPFACEAVQSNGAIAVTGYLAGDDPPITYAYEDMFVLYNDNYGEGDWDFITANSEQWVDNPLNLDGSPCFDLDSLHFSYVDSGHMTAIFDNNGLLHYPACFALCGVNTSLEDVYLEYFLYMKHIVFDPATGEFHIRNLWPLGEGPAEEPYLPWDENHDGEVDEYSEEGDVLSNHGWPIYWYDADDAFHENLFKIAADYDNERMCMVWSDGLKNRLFNVGGDDAYAEWANAPEIMISISGDNGDTWSEPIALNALETPELEGMIPCYVYPGDRIENIGDGYGRVHLFFLDDNSFGSFAQIGNGANDGGTLRYCSLDIYFGPTAVPEIEKPVVTNMLAQNHPNPFNPQTTISFSLPQNGRAELAVYNVRGELVKTLVSGPMTAGENVVTWNGTDSAGKPVGTGVYFYRLRAAGRTEVRKMLLLK